MPVALIVAMVVVLLPLLAVASGTNSAAAAALAFLVLDLLGLYLAPIIVAHQRKHANATPITLLSLLTGWTVLGWLVCIVWAFTDNTTDNMKATPP
jgi:hypothetical protein